MRHTEQLYALTALACLTLFAGGAIAGSDDDLKETKVLASAKHEKGLLVEVLEIKRDAHDQLYVRWRYRNPTDEPIELVGKSQRFRTRDPDPKEVFWNTLYYFEGRLADDAAYRVGIVRTAGSNKPYSVKVLPRDAVVIRPNKEYEVWACLYPPAKSVSKITLHIPETELIEGLTVPKAGKPRNTSAPERTTSPSEDDSRGQESKVLASGKSVNGLIVEVLEIKRVDRERFSVRCRYRNPTDESRWLIAPARRFVGKDDTDDPAKGVANKKFAMIVIFQSGRDVYAMAKKGGDWVCKPIPRQGVMIRPDETWEFWACFEVPDDETVPIKLLLASEALEPLKIPKATKE
jgi:hypothetical protein